MKLSSVPSGGGGAPAAAAAAAGTSPAGGEAAPVEEEKEEPAEESDEDVHHCNLTVLTTDGLWIIRLVYPSFCLLVGTYQTCSPFH